MKLLSILGLLCSTASVVSGSQLTPRAPKCPKPDGTTDAQIIAAYKSSGQCFSYTGAGNREKSIAPCAGADGYCQKVKGVENAAAGVSQYDFMFHSQYPVKRISDRHNLADTSVLV